MAADTLGALLDGKPSTLRSSLPITLSVMASRVLGVAREALLLALFPVAVTDAYRIAFQIPNLLRDLLAEGALSSAFVPTFTAALAQDGKARARQLANRVLTAIVLVTGALVLGGMLWPAPVVGLISGGFAGDTGKLALTAALLRWMMPITLLISVGAVLMGMLNAQGRFTVPALASAVFNLVNIAGGGLLLVIPAGHPAGVTWFAIATLAAAVVQTAIQLPGLVRLGFRPALALAGVWRDPGVRRIARLMAPAVIGLAAVQVNVFVNVRFASALGDGPVTYLSNAFRLFYLPVGLFGVALATVTTTRVSQEAARGDRGALALRTAEGGSAIAMLASASAVGLVLLAEPVVTLIYERGAFTHADAIATARALQMYMLGVLPYSLVKGLVPGFYALDRPRVPMLASLVAVAANVTFNVLTVARLGAPGLALGTTVAALVNYGILRLYFRRIVGPLPRLPGRSPARDLAALVLGNLVLAGVVLGGYHGGLALLVRAGLPVGAHGRGVVGGVWLLLTIAAGFASYAALLGRLGYPGAASLLGLPGKLARRLRGR